ncbi:UNVERIFIED_CONTAM: putative plastid-lipid-associated protein 10, chloroplastic [Sesamum radiatum]|uniref:Plastid-lipid-associated protein 10, chloroplastic n=1 Tax=Sesamum radiatum TaxID=300843 RepID=A0AAW2L5K0_SESRA
MEAASSLSLSTTQFSLLPVSSRRTLTLPLRQKPRFLHSPLCWAAASSSVPIATRIAIQNINISEELQALLAPAILPRSFLSLQILQFIKSFKAQVPVSSSQRRSVGGLYYLSYMDRNMLLGRAVGGGGVFIFTRAHSLI